ncbi:MAG: hypothetical protein LBS85_06780, partial [Clostridiales Family XIII bacterium]|nr:hypothetical protein [Clostridiales Family XIII bacterium]
MENTKKQLYIAESARKHYQRDNISDVDVLFVYNHPLRIVSNFEDNPNKELLFGVDSKIRTIEEITIE